jgi:2-haloacid dehalogenase
MKYSALLLDADDTIFDFGAAEAYSIRKVLAFAGIDDPAAPNVYHEINAGYWRALERGETTQERLKVDRFRDLAARYGCKCDPLAMTDMYVGTLATRGDMIPGALETVAAIARRMPVAIVTNGISQVQHGRFDSSPIMAHISALVISGEIGYAKPDPRLLFAALDKLGGIAPEKALMIGDSLTSDIAAANAAGIDVCWYNPNGKPLPEKYKIAGELHSIYEAVAFATAD